HGPGVQPSGRSESPKPRLRVRRSLASAPAVARRSRTDDRTASVGREPKVARKNNHHQKRRNIKTGVEKK
ncbi:hypothetical protein BWQ11_23940, partial [Salmonella enterica subsp. enterica serovar Stanley]|nr:hypothetical protein [Salmonella enterica subsp. enterica serovar Stanley]